MKSEVCRPTDSPTTRVYQARRKVCDGMCATTAFVA